MFVPALIAIPLTIALVYSVLVMVAARRYLGVRPPERAAGPPEPISILKPLAGLDEDLESNLRTFFEQDYRSSKFSLLCATRTIRRRKWWSGCEPSIPAFPRA